VFPFPSLPVLPTSRQWPKYPLRDDGRGRGALILPGGRQHADCLVVAGQAVDARLDQNQAELGVLVLAVALKVLADGDSLEEVIRSVRCCRDPTEALERRVPS
jgi:hypothetical protein